MSALTAFGVAAISWKASSRSVGTQLLVEEVLQLQRPAALDRVLGIERRLRIAPLERRDDLRRVADRLAVELQHREGRDRAAGQRQGSDHVEPAGIGARRSCGTRL